MVTEMKAKVVYRELLKEDLEVKQTLRIITTCKKEMAAKDELKRRRDSHPNINLQQAAPVSPG